MINIYKKDLNQARDFIAREKKKDPKINKYLLKVLVMQDFKKVPRLNAEVKLMATWVAQMICNIAN